jgi:hypothetical protein
MGIKDMLATAGIKLWKLKLKSYREAVSYTLRIDQGKLACQKLLIVSSIPVIVKFQIL